MCEFEEEKKNEFFFAMKMKSYSNRRGERESDFFYTKFQLKINLECEMMKGLLFTIDSN